MDPSVTAGPANLPLPNLRVAVVAGQDHLDSIRRACLAFDVQREDWDSGAGSDGPDLLVIESSGLRERPTGTGAVSEEKVARAMELVYRSEREGVPTALWETQLARRIDTPLALMRRVQHRFVVDPEAVRDMAEKLNGRRPILLPLAAQVVPDTVPGFEQRSNQITFLGQWASWFSGGRREELEFMLDAAREHGLVIFQREGETREKYKLPERFASFARTVPSKRHAVEAFRDSRIVIGIDPRGYGRLMVPQVAFDAAAAGSVVITPNHLAIRRLLGNTTVMIKTPEEATTAFERFLGNEDEWREASERGRAAILHADVYANRIATIASAMGMSVFPWAIGPMHS